MSVLLDKVPLNMYSWEGLSFVTSPVGFPVKLHPETIACTNLEEAKVFVNVDVTKAFPREITFLKEGKQFTVSYFYPWLPASCKFCDKWGHGEAVCAVKMKSQKRQNDTSPASKEGSDARIAKMKSSEVVKVSSEGESSRKSPDSEGLKVNNEATVAKEVLGDKIYSNSKGSGCEGNVWSLPARASI